MCKCRHPQHLAPLTELRTYTTTTTWAHTSTTCRNDPGNCLYKRRTELMLYMKLFFYRLGYNDEGELFSILNHFSAQAKSTRISVCMVLYISVLNLRGLLTCSVLQRVKYVTYYSNEKCECIICLNGYLLKT